MSVVAIEFLNPGRLWLLVAVAAVGGAYLFAQQWRRQASVRFTQVDFLDEIAPQRPGWRRHVVAACMLAGLACGVVAIARPIERDTERTRSEGRIMLLFDVSLSMMADDVSPTRLQAAQDAAHRFVDRVSPDIEIGLVSFARSAVTEVDPTTSRSAINNGIDRLQLAEYTAIGDAVASATNILVNLADEDTGDGRARPTTTNPDEESKPPGAIVLLTDGETTIGLTTEEGGQIAAAADVPVFAISFGTMSGTITDPSTGQVLTVGIAPGPMRDLAEATGGAFYEAASEDELNDAYSQIQELLQETLGEEIEVVVEQTWGWTLGALALILVGWLLSLWWLRGML